ncbi:MAG: site-specific integrase, partial [Sporolactobacillus sp.]
MKPTDFSYYLTGFLTKFLPGEVGASQNTIHSYRDTFILFLRFLRDKKDTSADELTLKMIHKNWIVDYLNWIEGSRQCSVSTRNVRLAALHSFFKYLQYENPDHLLEWQAILSIPMKKAKKKMMNYLSLDGIKLLLSMPNTGMMAEHRNLALLTLLYDTGARVQ